MVQLAGELEHHHRARDRPRHSCGHRGGPDDGVAARDHLHVTVATYAMYVTYVMTPA